MNRTILVFLAGVVAGGLLLGGVALSQEKDKHAKYGREIPEMTPEKQAEYMKEWMELVQPGKFHERLEYFVGEWTYEQKIHQMGPAPMVTKGTSKASWLLPNRYIETEWEGSMGGMPVTGFTVMGYDNFRREYVTMLGSSMDTTLYRVSGYIDVTGRVITQYGRMDEPGMKQIGKVVKYVTEIVDDDTYTFSIYDLDIEDGGRGDPLVIEITFQRKK